jgi:hypothetical protein
MKTHNMKAGLIRTAALATLLSLTVQSFGAFEPKKLANTMRGVVYFNNAVWNKKPAEVKNPQGYVEWGKNLISGVFSRAKKIAVGEKTFGAATLTLQTGRALGWSLSKHEGPYYKLEFLDPKGKIVDTVRGKIVVTYGSVPSGLNPFGAQKIEYGDMATVDLRSTENENSPVMYLFGRVPHLREGGVLHPPGWLGGKNLVFQTVEGPFKDLGAYKVEFFKSTSKLTETKLNSMMQLEKRNAKL